MANYDTFLTFVIWGLIIVTVLAVIYFIFNESKSEEEGEEEREDQQSNKENLKGNRKDPPSVTVENNRSKTPIKPIVEQSNNKNKK